MYLVTEVFNPVHEALNLHIFGEGLALGLSGICRNRLQLGLLIDKVLFKLAQIHIEVFQICGKAVFNNKITAKSISIYQS